LQVFVPDNNVDQALRILKRKMQSEGVFREMKGRHFMRNRQKQEREKSRKQFAARKLGRNASGS
jgi:small subunit ribosomal protein S21